MLWIKAFHVIFMVTWFAGLFYLPRLFVYHVETADETGHQRFCTMERKLYAMATIGMVLTWAFGIWMLTLVPEYLKMGWLHAKLALVVLLLAHFIAAGRWLKGVAAGKALPTATTLRWFNEIPVLVLAVIVWLALAKPF